MDMDDIINAQDHEAKLKAWRDAAEEAERQKRINYGLTFSTMEGFEVLKDIAAMCHINEISYVPSNQFETAFREGERNVWLYIMSHLSDELKTKILGGF